MAALDQVKTYLIRGGCFAVWLIAKALRLDPLAAIAWGLAYGKKDDFDQAIAEYGQALSLAVAYNNRGLAYDGRGDYGQAIEDYTEAIRLKPDHAVAYNNRGGVYEKKGDYDRAIADHRYCCTEGRLKKPRVY